MKNVVSSKKMGHLKILKLENFKYDNNDMNAGKVNKQNSIMNAKFTHEIIV